MTGQIAKKLARFTVAIEVLDKIGSCLGQFESVVSVEEVGIIQQWNQGIDLNPLWDLITDADRHLKS